MCKFILIPKIILISEIDYVTLKKIVVKKVPNGLSIMSMAFCNLFVIISSFYRNHLGRFEIDRAIITCLN